MINTNVSFFGHYLYTPNTVKDTKNITSSFDK